jgi:alkaline phosphatase
MQAIADSAYESTTGSCGTKGTKSACSADRAVDGSLEDLNRWLSGTDSLT